MFCGTNQNLLGDDKKDEKIVSMLSLKRTAEKSRKLINPVKMWEVKLSHENIANLQKSWVQKYCGNPDYSTRYASWAGEHNLQAYVWSTVYTAWKHF